VILDLFAGVGGWDLAAINLGQDVLGIELDPNPCATRRAAGLKTVQADVSKIDLTKFEHGSYSGLIASPPCQTFSVAGKRLGLSDVRGQLVYEVIRWGEAMRPDWIACEQVPAVLPIWKMFAHEFAEMGYNTWTGILNAADFGVPQIRKRAIMMCSLKRFASPSPTHSQKPESSLFGELEPWVTMAQALGWGFTEQPSGTVLGASENGGGHGLDGGAGARDAMRRAMGIRTRGEADSGGNVFNGADGPSWAVTSKSRSWNFDDQEAASVMLNTGRDWKEGEGRDAAQTVDTDQEPAPTVTAKSGGQWLLKGGGWALHNRRFDPEGEPSPTVMFGHDAANWAWERPATTVVSEFRPMVIAAPGWRTEPDDSRQDAEGSIKVTVEEVAALQTFPKDYPWQGSKTSKFRQIGNAIPVKLAEAILKELV